jgi:hypothetical protein
MGKAVYAAAAAMLATLSPAHAADGCTVLLCLAGNWRAISQCVQPVHEALRDAARGRGWPICNMATAAGGSSVSANNDMLSPASCPPQYLLPIYSDQRVVGWQCTVAGRVTTNVDGQWWTRTYWSMDGAAVTEYSAAARAALKGTVDETYEQGLASWRESSVYRLWLCSTKNEGCSDDVPVHLGGEP